MKNRILLIAAAFGIAVYGVGAKDALAQSAAEKPMEHPGMTDHQGHHMGAIARWGVPSSLQRRPEMGEGV